MAVSRRNIGHSEAKIGRDSRNLVDFGTWTENPRVGGSIPPLATIQIRKLVEVSGRASQLGTHLVSILKPRSVSNPVPNRETASNPAAAVSFEQRTVCGPRGPQFTFSMSGSLQVLLSKNDLSGP